jgi:hypothetical protein
MRTPKKPESDADLKRIDQALADIDRHCQEIQQEIQPAQSERDAIANLLAETKRCQRLTALEIDNVVAETAHRRQKMRSPWRSFAVGFTIGTMCFVAAAAFLKFLG